MSDNQERSGLHRQVERWLTEAGYDFESEVGFYPYRVDIYFWEWHIAVEVDGPFGHTHRKDAERDARLKQEYGLAIVHISHKDIKKKPTVQKIRDFIAEHCDSAEERRLVNG